nr:general secretion pathway protein GspB [Hydrogenophaga sp.]
MSYILDALRRADAERERGRVPGLHSQVSLPREPQAPRKAPRSRAAPVWALAVAALGWWLRPVPGAVAPGPDGSPSAVAIPPTVAQAPAAPPATPAPPAAAASSPAAPVPPAPAPILAPAAPAPAAASPRSAPATPTTPPAPATAAPADDSLPRVADLSPAARSGLPPLQVSGATYSQTPAMRMLIVDGQVLN